MKPENQQEQVYSYPTKQTSRQNQKRQRRPIHIGKGTIPQDDTTVVNICVLNTGASNFIKQPLKLGIRLLVGDIIISISILILCLNRSSRPRTKKVKLHHTSINGTLHPTTTEYTYFSAAHEILYKILNKKVSYNIIKSRDEICNQQ